MCKRVAMANEDEAPYHSSFSKMYDTDDEDHSCAVTIIQSSVKTGHDALTRPTEGIFDTVWHATRKGVKLNVTLL